MNLEGELGLHSSRKLFQRFAPTLLLSSLSIPAITNRLIPDSNKHDKTINNKHEES